jgi:hypothetical protein
VRNVVGTERDRVTRTEELVIRTSNDNLFECAHSVTVVDAETRSSMDRGRTTPVRRPGGGSPNVSRTGLMPSMARPKSPVAYRYAAAGAATGPAGGDPDRPRFNTSLGSPAASAQQAAMRQQLARQYSASSGGSAGNQQQQQQYSSGYAQQPRHVQPQRYHPTEFTGASNRSTPQHHQPSPYSTSNRSLAAGFTSPTAAAVSLAGRVAAAANPEEQLNLFSQLQQIVVQLSTRAVDDKRAITSMKAQLQEYSELLVTQDQVIEELKRANADVAAERDECLRTIHRLQHQMQQQQQQFCGSSSNGGGGDSARTPRNGGDSAPGAAADAREFAKAIMEQLRGEQRQRVQLEEQHSRLFEEQQRSIMNLEARLRAVGEGGGASTADGSISARRTPIRRVQSGHGADAVATAAEEQQAAAPEEGGESPSGNAEAAAIAARRIASPRSLTPSRFAASRQQLQSEGADDSAADPAPGARPSDPSAAAASVSVFTEVGTQRRLDLTVAIDNNDSRRSSTQQPHPMHVRLSEERSRSGSQPLTDTFTGARDRDLKTQEAFKRFAEALGSVELRGVPGRGSGMISAPTGPATPFAGAGSHPHRTANGNRSSGGGHRAEGKIGRANSADVASSPVGQLHGSVARATAPSSPPRVVSPGGYPSPPRRPSHSTAGAAAAVVSVGPSESMLQSAKSIDDLIASWRKEHLHQH